MSGKGGAYEDLVKLTGSGFRWTGAGRLVPKMLDQPLRWTKPRRIFVDSMSDLFYEGFSNPDIAAVFGIMAAAPQHTFQVLTKRARRMRQWFRWYEGESGAGACADAALWAAKSVVGSIDIDLRLSWPGRVGWPLPNVWLGVSAEDQQRADERIPELLATPAALRWVSVEPQIGPVDLSRWLGPATQARGMFDGILWIVQGGESGPGARPFDLAWAESMRDACKAAGVPWFMKQLGSVWAREHDAVSRAGADPSEWPEALRVQEFPQ